MLWGASKIRFVFMFSGPESKIKSNEVSLDDPGTQGPSPWVCTVRLPLRVETQRGWAENGSCFPSRLRHKPGVILVDSMRSRGNFHLKGCPSAARKMLLSIINLVCKKWDSVPTVSTFRVSSLRVTLPLFSRQWSLPFDVKAPPGELMVGPFTNILGKMDFRPQ